MLFVGESWNGSSARSLREAMALLPGVDVDDVSEDHYLPRHAGKFLRACNRLLRASQAAELRATIGTKLRVLQPRVLIVYKGSGVPADLVRQAKVAGTLTVNVFPDCSPHAHGQALRRAMGEYDLVISTKPFHPSSWASVYGYSNRCVFVPHGYDSRVHYWESLPRGPDLDLVMAASWRPEYGALMRAVADQTADLGLQVGVAGLGWRERRASYPVEWTFGGARYGRAYGEWLRRGKIAVAPVQRDMVVGGTRQPGDEDSTRTYELAAAQCFFLHRRTDYVQGVYDEQTEVPMWETAQELADLIRYYLPRREQRRVMASAAHARAVPAYSMSQRAAQILRHIGDALALSDGIMR